MECRPSFNPSCKVALVRPCFGFRAATLSDKPEPYSRCRKQRRTRLQFACVASDDYRSFGPKVFFSSKYQNIFAEEAIGAEHGEAFETFRPDGFLKIDVDFINNMCERGLERIGCSLQPEEGFGLIFSWDNVVADTQTLRMEAWKQLAFEEGKSLPQESETLCDLLSAGTDHVLCKVLFWQEDESEIERVKIRLAEIFYEKLSELKAPTEGLNEWLDALHGAGVPCAVASSLDRQNLLAALERMGLQNYFQAVVSEEDGMETIAQRFLSAAVKLGRPPYKCIVFEDDPRGITAAHNCTMMAVAVIGSHPAYELVQADLAVSSFSELSVINLRRLFANEGFKFMDLEKQIEDGTHKKRELKTDIMDLP